MKKNLTEIIFLLDRSGSMAGLEADTIGGFNSFIERQRQRPGDTIVTTVLFDHHYEVLWNGINIQEANLTNEQYFVRGSTALLDAIGKTIVDVGYRLSNTEEKERPDKVILVITTDGEENASNEFTYNKIKEMIQHQQEVYSWEFIFLGANIDVEQEAFNLGIDKDCSFSFDATKEGIESMYNIVCDVVSDRRGR
ncbi:VWA domain-containing protein [Bacillus timonensis]|nr:VWA domain-containing protein [Bacillus timonensis]